MATAIELISRAMRLAGVYALGETPTPAETAAGLTALNGLISSLANESLMIYEEVVDAIPITPGPGIITVGPSGSFVTARPIELLLSSYVVYQGVTYMCPPITIDQYNTITFKAQTAPFPWVLWWESNYPDGTLTVYPQPSDNSILYLPSKKPLTGFATPATSVALPPGYDEMLAFNLAINLGPEFTADIPQSVYARAANTKRVIKRTNAKPLVMALPNAVLPTNGWVNWRTGA